MASATTQPGINREQIERIVQAVLQRLGETPVAGKSVSSADAQAAQGVTLSERVITVASLEKLNGAKVVNVAEKAIVTPAAKDFLRDQGIMLQRTTAGSKSGVNPAQSGSAAISLVSFACDTAVETGTLIEQLARAGVVAACHGDWSGGISELIQMLGTAQNGKTICFTSQPSLVLCAANRHAALRAAAANCSCCVQEAAGSIGANVLVVKPRGKSQHQLVQLVREFATCGNACPPEIKQLLGTR